MPHLLGEEMVGIPHLALAIARLILRFNKLAHRLSISHAGKAHGVGVG
jgi:hypothetical protein